jgi:hypothetical protein
VKANEKTTISKEVKLNMNGLIFPNPASHNISINFKDEALELTIMNSFGIEVLSKKKIKNGELINIEGLAKGVYFVNVRSNQGMASQLLFKQ